MINKKLYIHAIIAGCLMLIGATCLMFGMRQLNALPEDVNVSSQTMILVGIGTLFSMSGMIALLVLLYKILKEKGII